MDSLSSCLIPQVKLIKCTDYCLVRKTQNPICLEYRLEMDEQNPITSILDFILHTAGNSWTTLRRGSPALTYILKIRYRLLCEEWISSGKRKVRNQLVKNVVIH